MSKRKAEPAEGVSQTDAPVFDPEAVAREQVAEHVGPHRVDHRHLALAVRRHTEAVAAAGKAVPLDWATRRVLTDGGAP